MIPPTWINRDGISLWHNDCFNIFPQIQDKSVDLILCDLPYSITSCSWDIALPLDQLWNHYKRIIKENGAIVLTASQPFTWKLCASNPDWFKYEIIWEKPNGTNPLLIKKQPFKVHENILVFYNKQPTYNPQMTYGHDTYGGFEDAGKEIGEVYGGDLISKHRENTDGSRYPRSVQRFPQDRGGHPTKKPVFLMEWLILTYSNEGEMVLDNCMGEGSTGVACINFKRKFMGIEKEKKYFDRAVEDMEKMGWMGA